MKKKNYNSFFCLFHLMLNIYGHVGTVSYLTTVPGQAFTRHLPVSVFAKTACLSDKTAKFQNCPKFCQFAGQYVRQKINPEKCHDSVFG